MSCILGGALGDAWGGPWEGSPTRVAFQIPERSSVSDDTELTLATCESIIENGGRVRSRERCSDADSAARFPILAPD